MTVFSYFVDDTMFSVHL